MFCLPAGKVSASVEIFLFGLDRAGARKISNFTRLFQNKNLILSPFEVSCNHFRKYGTWNINAGFNGLSMVDIKTSD